MGIPALLQEQNARPGITNRLLSRLAGRIAVAFEECQAFFGDKAVLTGNPVRAEFSNVSERKSSDRFVLLIFGGSQGSHGINQAMVEALGPLKPYSSSLRFIHQTGAKDLEWVSGAYHAAGVEGDVRPFFDDMPLQFSRSDLVICRSGAMTLAELTVAGKAAILVPFPLAADNHQQRNAEAMARAGAAEMILQPELSGKRLAERIIFFLEHRQALLQMEQKSREMGRPDAVEQIVRLMEELIHV
jgi:UDP-N-acetylglucosamine--N-acetylmuramyl-(pentapeptide) pyrophosphoryl-undecaprenol N-acetylglucosamine transferase